MMSFDGGGQRQRAKPSWIRHAMRNGRVWEHSAKLVIMNYTEAFKSFGAKLTNVLWSTSAIAEDGSLVLAIWAQAFKRGPEKETMVVDDSLTAWPDWKGPGPVEFKRHLDDALHNRRPIRIIVVTPISGAKDIEPKPDMVGTLELWDSDHYRIVIRKA